MELKRKAWNKSVVVISNKKFLCIIYISCVISITIISHDHMNISNYFLLKTIIIKYRSSEYWYFDS